MSILIALPEAVQGAAQDLAGIGSNLSAATAQAAGPTTGIAAAAEDEISAVIAKIFGEYGQEYQAISAQARAFHTEFANLMNASAGAYLSSEITNAETLGHSALGSISGMSAALQTGALGTFINNTVMNLEDIFTEISADPFPVLSQFFTNQANYIGLALANLPTNLANLPATIQTGVNNLISFPALAMPTLQLVNPFLHDFSTALLDLPGSIATAGQQLLSGNISGSLGTLGNGFLHLFVQPPFIDIGISGDPLTPPGLVITPHLVGPLGDLLDAILVPGLLFQNLATAVGTNTVPGMIAQNIGNALLTLTKTQISLGALIGLSTTTGLTAALTNTFSLPVQLAIDALGAPTAALLAPGGVIPTATTFLSDLETGNALGALNTLFGAPVSITNAFLNGQFDLPISVPLPPFSLNLGSQIIFGQQLLGTTTVMNGAANLNIPFDGLLVGETPITSSIDGMATGTGVASNALALLINSQLPLDLNVTGTPISGLVKGLFVFAPEELANAINPDAGFVDPIGIEAA